MTDQQNSITPPPKLVQQWADEFYGGPGFSKISSDDLYLAARAAQWGADQELDACVELTRDNDGYDAALGLRATRRPKPPSLKEDALAALHGIHDQGPTPEQVVTIRRALEALPE
jgi:hypothetical protein